MTISSETQIENDDIDPGDDTLVPDIPLSVLESKYREQMRQIFANKIELPLFGLENQIAQQIDLRPQFQRRDRWSNEKRSRFIESIIMNVPVPPVFLGEEEYGKYVVLDGRQRLTAVNLFLTNNLRLDGLKIWSELNGLTWHEIKNKGFAASIERRFLPAVLLTRESSPEVKYEVFDRLNTGGVQAEQMEIRNAVFQGEFNKLLHQLSSDAQFRALWGIPTSGSLEELENNSLYRNMSDLEIVLRFFALSGGTLKGMKFNDLLSDFMKERNEAYAANPEARTEDAERFRRGIANVHDIFGPEAFRRPILNATRKSKRSVPYSDALLIALADVDTAQLGNPGVVDRIREEITNLSTCNDEFIKAISTGTNGETAVNTRITLAKDAVQNALRAS